MQARSASAIGRRFGYGYHEVRRALNMLELVESPARAEEIVVAWASDRVEALDDAAKDWVDAARVE